MILVLSPAEAMRMRLAGPKGLVEGRDYIIRKEIPVMAKKGKPKPKPRPKPRPTGY
jgi:hypothetical protein